MDGTVYSTRAWRKLPRTHCVVRSLFGEAVGPCRGLIHRHHVDPSDEHSRTIQVCAGHHARIHKALTELTRPREEPRRRCPHQHRYDYARRECERRLNTHH